VSGTCFQPGSPAVLMDGGKLTVSGMNFGQTGTHYRLAEGAQALRAFGNVYTGRVQIQNDAGIRPSGSDFN